MSTRHHTLTRLSLSPSWRFALVLAAFLTLALVAVALAAPPDLRGF
jgi:hypothetical protein